MKTWSALLFCMMLFLTACGSSGSDQASEVAPEEPDSAALTRVVLEATLEALDDEQAQIEGEADTQEPGAVASYYVNACEMNDPVSAKDVVSFASPKPCRIPEEAISSRQLGDAEISGKTARISWSFELPEERQQVVLLTLGLSNEVWGIISIDVIEETWLKEEVVEIESEIQEQFDEDLPKEIVYLVQEGSTGSKTVTQKLTKTWNDGTGTTESEVLNEEILTEAVPTIIIVGKSKDEIAPNLVGLVENY